MEMLVNITVPSSATLGARSVVVMNSAPGGGTATLASGFSVDSSPATSVEYLLSIVPVDYVLHEAYPNPFNPSTRIRYGVPERSTVRLEVYDMVGKSVAVLISGERSAGYYEVEWMANGQPSGVYIVRLITQSTSKTFSASRKLMLMK